MATVNLVYFKVSFMRLPTRIHLNNLGFNRCALNVFPVAVQLLLVDSWKVDHRTYHEENQNINPHLGAPPSSMFYLGCK